MGFPDDPLISGPVKQQLMGSKGGGDEGNANEKGRPAYKVVIDEEGGNDEGDAKGKGRPAYKVAIDEGGGEIGRDGRLGLLE